MKLRDLASPLEAALTRLTEKPESQRPCLVVEAEPKNKTGLFIQYAGSAAQPLVLEVCFNVVTREIPGFESAAKEFFGCEMRIAEDETNGVWDKECASVVRAVELGMYALRYVLRLDWGRELSIDEIEDEPIDRMRRALVLGGLS